MHTQQLHDDDVEKVSKKVTTNRRRKKNKNFWVPLAAAFFCAATTERVMASASSSDVRIAACELWDDASANDTSMCVCASRETVPKHTQMIGLIFDWHHF